jgi:4-hydroxyphenylpyruvate dioxygenase
MSKEITSVEYGLEKIFEGAQDFLPLLGTDYVEFYVGNAKQSAHFYKTAFGFQSMAYRGLETGSKDSVSYVLKQDKIKLVLTTPLNSKSPINDHIVKHGDGVKVVALWVEDARSAWEETTKRGAKSFMEPIVEKDEHGEVVRSGIYTYGETVHIFVERKNYNGIFLPGFVEWKSDYNPEPLGLKQQMPCLPPDFESGWPMSHAHSISPKVPNLHVVIPVHLAIVTRLSMAQMP